MMMRRWFSISLLVASLFGLVGTGFVSANGCEQTGSVFYGPFCAQAELRPAPLPFDTSVEAPAVWRFVVAVVGAVTLIALPRAARVLQLARLRFRRRFLHPKLHTARPFLREEFLPGFSAVYDR